MQKGRRTRKSVEYYSCAAFPSNLLHCAININCSKTTHNVSAIQSSCSGHWRPTQAFLHPYCRTAWVLLPHIEERHEEWTKQDPEIRHLCLHLFMLEIFQAIRANQEACHHQNRCPWAHPQRQQIFPAPSWISVRKCTWLPAL